MNLSILISFRFRIVLFIFLVGLMVVKFVVEFMDVESLLKVMMEGFNVVV